MKKVTMLWAFALLILTTGILSSNFRSLACNRNELNLPTTEKEQNVFEALKANDGCSKTLSFTYDEAQLLMKVACSETGDLGEDAQLLVMNVIVNRLNDEAFPDNIHDVIYAPKQFSVVMNGSFDKVTLNVESHLALARLEKGEDISQGALYFEAASAKDTWQSKNKEFLFELYGQRFYK